MCLNIFNNTLYINNNRYTETFHLRIVDENKERKLILFINYFFMNLSIVVPDFLKHDIDY